MDNKVFILFLILGLGVIFVSYQFVDSNLSSHTKPKTNESVENKSLTLPLLFEMSESGIVQIHAKNNENSSQSQSIGSGFVYDDLGHIITNYHVLKDADFITITFVDGTVFDADLVGFDPHTDLALIKVPPNVAQLHKLPIGNSSNLKVGEQIIAIGNPFGLSGSMTTGIISQIGRLLYQNNGFIIPDVIQTDAAVNPGNSGGPLLNLDAQVVGITTAIRSNTGDFTGVGFAIPSNTVKKIIPVLIDNGIYDHPWIGITGNDVDFQLSTILHLNSSRGFLVEQVIQDGPASKSGIQGFNKTIQHKDREYRIGGDIILKIDDQVVRKISDILIYLQREKNVGDTLILQILRSDKMIDVEIILEKRP